MTTIAYRDGIIAGDTSMCVGGIMFGGTVKIARNEHGDLAGAAGDAAYVSEFLRWFAGGEDGEAPDAEEDDDCIDRGIIVRTVGNIVVFEPRGSFVVRAECYALGSGKAEAMGAMLAGASAERAVEIAGVLDPHTGGQVMTLARDAAP